MTTDIDYGNLTKRIVFTENDHRHAQLVLKLKYLRITQSGFFRHIITGLINDDPHILEYTNEISKNIASQLNIENQMSIPKIKKISLNMGLYYFHY